MPLINRFSRLFTADMHAVLDRIEEPDVVLRQAVRDMESELAVMREKAQAAKLETERAATAERNLEQQQKTCDEELDICFAAGEDDLARSLVRRKLEAEKRRQAAHSRGAEAGRAAAALEQSILECSEKLAAMREKVALLDRGAGTAVNDPVDVAVGRDEVDIAFLREKQRRGQA